MTPPDGRPQLGAARAEVGARLQPARVSAPTGLCNVAMIKDKSTGITAPRRPLVAAQRAWALHCGRRDAQSCPTKGAARPARIRTAEALASASDNNDSASSS
jgi:hypothetical protein